MKTTPKNKPKPIPVLILLVLSPIIVPAYLLGKLSAIVWASAYCGYTNTVDYFMDGLGFETNQKIIERLLEEKFKL